MTVQTRLHGYAGFKDVDTQGKSKPFHGITKSSIFLTCALGLER